MENKRKLCSSFNISIKVLGKGQFTDRWISPNVEVCNLKTNDFAVFSPSFPEPSGSSFYFLHFTNWIG